MTGRRRAVGMALDGTRAQVERWVQRAVRGAEAWEAVIPLVHRRQPEGWSAYVIALPEAAAAPAPAARWLRSLEDPGGAVLRAADELALQDGLDLFYPRRSGTRGEHALFQSIEYVTSLPETRAAYYEIQTRFSGPAMRRLHERDRNGRFIGFEVVERPFVGEAVPDWDVIHVSGFRFWQAVKCVPHFFAAFEDAARAIGEPSGRAIMRGWDEQRAKRTLYVKQLMGCTVSSAALLSEEGDRS